MTTPTRRILVLAAPWVLLALAAVAAVGVSGPTDLKEVETSPRPLAILVQPGSAMASGWPAFFACAGGLNRDEGVVRETLRLNDTSPLWTPPLTAPTTVYLALSAGQHPDLPPGGEDVVRAVSAAKDCEAVS